MAKIYDLVRRDGRGICSVLLTGRNTPELELSARRLAEWIARNSGWIGPVHTEATERRIRDLRFDHGRAAIRCISPESEALAERIREYVNRFKWTRPVTTKYDRGE